MASDAVNSAHRADVTDWTSVCEGIALIASKWALPVVAQLSTGPKRHNELCRALDVDHKQLGRALGRLQDAQLVSRKTDVTGQPVQVWYQLTRCGRELVPLLLALGTWSDSLT